jgi:hypothetical protein
VLSEDSRVLTQENRSGSAKSIKGNPQVICLAERADLAAEKQAHQRYKDAKALESHLSRFPL